MFVLIIGTAQFKLTSDDARRLYLRDGAGWKPGPSMADRCIITAPDYSLTAPLNWRDMIGATK